MYTVLIAEDELLVRIGIASSVPWAEMNLRLIGEAEDGESAWNLYEKFRPDIVITDIRMPGMDGMELLRRIRGEDRECAVIIITNVEHDETLREAQMLGITDVLLKASMKQEYIRLALEKACQSLPKANAGEEVRDEGALWRAALLEGENLLLVGSKATGKNILADNLAWLFGRPVYSMSFHVNTPFSKTMTLSLSLSFFIREIISVSFFEL